MSKVFIDPELAHVGLDSGALTMLGAVAQRFETPGEYRGTVRRGKTIERVFYLSVDKESPVAAADIDLAVLARTQSQAADGNCCPQDKEPRFTVNPRGYAMFRVSGGPGGYSVNLRRADPDEKTPVFNSTRLDDGAVYSARILRPGLYSVTNSLSKARCELTVAYPPGAFTGYRPPDALRVEVTERGFKPERIAIAAAQGLIFDCNAPARIVIALEKADDGPRTRVKTAK
ncbi:MAG: hypothetical protein WCC57_12615 [Paracoccaceae bacterium]